MMERPYYIDFGTFRLVIHKLVTSKYFDLGISAVIGLNVITMAMEFYMMPDVSQDQSNNCLLSLEILLMVPGAGKGVKNVQLFLHGRFLLGGGFESGCTGFREILQRKVIHTFRHI